MFETIPQTINVDSLEKYKLNESSETNIYSEEGIFSIQKNILYKKNNNERYPDFKLYKMISRTVHHLEPHNVINEPIFKHFSVFEKQINKAKLMNIDEIPVMFLNNI